MIARDGAARVLAEHRIECTGPEGVTCRCRESGWMSLRAFNAHVAGVLAAAGLLRPDPTCACGDAISPRYAAEGVCQNCYGTTDDPTGEDREALARVINTAGWRQADPHTSRDGSSLEFSARDAADAVLAAGFSRPRGPVTETPAVTGFDYAWMQDGSALALYAMPGVPFRTADEAAELGLTLGAPGKVIRRPRGRWEPLGIEVRAGDDRG